MIHSRPPITGCALLLFELDQSLSWKLIGSFILGVFIILLTDFSLGTGIHPLVLVLAPVTLLRPGNGLNNVASVLPIDRKVLTRLAWYTRVVMVPLVVSTAAVLGVALDRPASVATSVDYWAALLFPAMGYMAWDFIAHGIGDRRQRAVVWVVILGSFLFIPVSIAHWGLLHFAVVTAGIAGLFVRWNLACVTPVFRPRAARPRFAAKPTPGDEFALPDVLERRTCTGVFGTMPRWSFSLLIPVGVMLAALALLSRGDPRGGIVNAYAIGLLLPVLVLFGHSPQVYATLPLTRARRAWIPIRNHVLMSAVACAIAAPAIQVPIVPAAAIIAMVGGYGFLGKVSARLIVFQGFSVLTAPAVWLLRRATRRRRSGGLDDYLVAGLGWTYVLGVAILGSWLFASAVVYGARVAVAGGPRLYVVGATAPVAFLVGVWLLHRYDHRLAMLHAREFPRPRDGRSAT